MIDFYRNISNELLAIETIRDASEDEKEKCVSDMFRLLESNVKQDKTYVPIAAFVIAAKIEEGNSTLLSLKFSCSEVGEVLVVESGMSREIADCFKKEADMMRKKLQELADAFEGIKNQLKGL